MRSKVKTPTAFPAPIPQNTVERPARKHIRRLLVFGLVVFVVAGVSVILYVMLLWLPQQYRQQAARMLAPSIRAAEIDDILYFGAYEQDNDTENGPEPIEWVVLDREDDRCLLMSWYALDCIRFNSAEAFVTWDRSSILTWLNSSFYYGAFNGAERAMLVPSEQLTDTNPYFDTDPGEPTNVKIFLLNIAQVAKYMPTEESRLCKPTAYTVERGAITDKETDCCIWWLRSPGFDESAATRVLMDGRINYCGYRVQSNRQAVRPCMWVTYDPDPAK